MQNLSSCFGKLIKNQFSRLMMGIRQKALFMVLPASFAEMSTTDYVLEVYFRLECLLCCPQTEFSLLMKQPVSCTRTSPSLWLFLLLKVIMVSDGNLIHSAPSHFLHSFHVYILCLIYRDYICLWADLLWKNLHHDGEQQQSWCDPSGCGRCLSNH